MAYTVYEYQSVTSWGEPIEPPSLRTASQAFDASFRLQKTTVYCAVAPDADMRLRIDSAAAQAATSADQMLAAGPAYGFPVRRHSQPYLYGIAA